MVATAPTPVVYSPRGAARELLECRDFEILVEGPVGTGKTFGILWKLHLCALKYDGMRALMVRKTQKSLTESVIQTYLKILQPADWGVEPFSGNISEPRSFRYPNGSRLVVGGMDNPGKVMSAEYDMGAYFEATQGRLNEWEDFSTRMRNGMMPYQQLIADCNPDVPTHWLNQRANDGILTRLRSRHRDNPRLWDDRTQDWTDFGRSYVIDRLGRLTGVRRKRNLEGLWVAAEGQVYEEWDPETHVLPWSALPDGKIPDSWPRYWVIDFGYTNPFVWQWWAEDPDGRLYLYREIYMTGKLVEDHAAIGMALSQGEPKPVAVITDHDAEDRHTFTRKTGYRTTPAHKAKTTGIQAVSARLRVAGDGKPRLYVMEGALVEMDAALREAGLPTSTEQEFPSYVWPVDATGKAVKEEPVKENDHGMDATRYMVAHKDLRPRKGAWAP